MKLRAQRTTTMDQKSDSTPLNDVAPVVSYPTLFDRPRPVWLKTTLWFAVVGMGMVEGVAFHRTGIFVPNAIYGQMVFRVWVVMKMFLAAVGSSMIAQSVMDILRPQDFDYSRAFKWATWGTLRVAVGGATLGVGMSLAGSGPTMVPAQLGAGVGHAWATVLGVLAGGTIFALVEAKAFSTDTDPKEGQLLTVDQIARKRDMRANRYWHFALPIGTVLIASSALLEWIVPRAADEARLGVGSLPWPPICAGLVVGFSQLPFRFIAGHGHGGSTAVMTFLSTITFGLLSPRHRVKGFQQTWQFSYVWLGTLFGALLSAHLSPTTFSPEGMSIWRSIVGGALMIFGSRLAGGCTCGHGVSGTSELSVESLITTASIFGGAIATGFIIQAAS